MIALLSAIAGGLVTGGVVLLFADDGEENPVEAGEAADSGTVQQITVEQSSAVMEAAARGRASVVRIESVRSVVGGQEHDIGSGVVFDEAGYIVTNAHVVLGTESLKVILPDGSERPAILLGHDYPFTDIAVLQVAPGGLTAIEAGDPGALQPGETIVVIGNPLAEFDGSVSVGVVSGLDRTRIFDAVAQRDLIQTDAAVNNGNSGGALLNLRGQLVGIPTSVIRESAGGTTVEGMAFALPSDRVLEVAGAIIANQGSVPRPGIGVAHRDLAEGAPGGVEGALVTAVAPGGPADLAGIVPGDVVTAIGNEEVNASQPLLNALMAFEPGESARVVLNRNGRIIETEVQFGTYH